MAVVVIIFFLLFINNRIWRRLCLCTITLLLTCCIFCPKICWMHELLHALFALKFTHTNFEPMHVNSYMQLSTCRHVYYMYHMYVCAYACTSVYRITHRRVYVFVFFYAWRQSYIILYRFLCTSSILKYVHKYLLTYMCVCVCCCQSFYNALYLWLAWLQALTHTLYFVFLLFYASGESYLIHSLVFVGDSAMHCSCICTRLLM